MKKKPIPFFGPAREFAKHRSAMMREVAQVYASGQVLQGPQVTQFEEGVARLTGRRWAVAVNSGTDALYFALTAAGIKSGDEVLVTDFSFIASASAIVRSGARPVFVDIADDFNMDFKAAARWVTPKTKALVAVHLYGQMMDPVAAEAFAQNHNLVLIEDAAQAFGAKRSGRPAGSVGLASAFSFDPTKPLSAPGSGGMFLTDDEAIASRVRRLRYHGKGREQGIFLENGFNSQMPSATAALLNFKLKHQKRWTKRRRQIAQLYIKELENCPGLKLPSEAGIGSHIWHKFVIRCGQRNSLKNFLEDQGVETMVHYPRALRLQPFLMPLAQEGAYSPQASLASQTVLSLPIHPYLTDQEVRRVARSVRDFCLSTKPALVAS